MRLAVKLSNDREVIYPNRMQFFLSASCVWQLQLFLSWIMWLTVLYLSSLCLIFLFGPQCRFTASRLVIFTCHWVQIRSEKHPGSTRTVQLGSQWVESDKKKEIKLPLCIIKMRFYSKLPEVVIWGFSNTIRIKHVRGLCWYIAAVLCCSPSQDTVTIAWLFYTGLEGD